METKKSNEENRRCNMNEYRVESFDLLEIANEIAEELFLEAFPILAFINDIDYYQLENQDKVDMIETSKTVKLVDLQEKKVVFCVYKFSESGILDGLADDWEHFTGGCPIKVRIPLFLGE